MSFIYRDFDLLDQKEQGKLLKGSIVPRPIAWITTSNEDNLINLAPFSYFNMVNSSTVMVSFRRFGNRKKDTANNILLKKEAVINIADDTLIKELDDSSIELDSNVSELTLNSLNLINSTKVSVPGILEAPIKLEVILLNHLELMNYDNSVVESDLMILRVVGASFNDEVIDQDKNYVLLDKLNPISRLGGPDYGKTILDKKYKRNF